MIPLIARTSSFSWFDAALTQALSAAEAGNHDVASSHWSDVNPSNSARSGARCVGSVFRMYSGMLRREIASDLAREGRRMPCDRTGPEGGKLGELDHVGGYAADVKVGILLSPGPDARPPSKMTR